LSTRPAVCFIFFQNCSQLFWQHFLTRIDHPGASTSPSDVKYFTIWGFTIRGQYFTKMIFCWSFILEILQLEKRTDQKIAHCYTSELNSSCYENMRFSWNPSLRTTDVITLQIILSVSDWLTPIIVSQTFNYPNSGDKRRLHTENQLSRLFGSTLTFFCGVGVRWSQCLVAEQLKSMFVHF
jgi:hypothetical protein